ncbi:MAG: hypothetical protein ABEI75_02160 [Halobaculum sp.]
MRGTRLGGGAVAVSGGLFLWWVTQGGVGRATATAVGTVVLLSVPAAALLAGLLAAGGVPFAGGFAAVGGSVVGVYGLFLIFAVTPVLGGVSLLGVVVFAGGTVGVVAGLRAFGAWVGLGGWLSVPEDGD